jgi:hypothetical protein
MEKISINLSDDDLAIVDVLVEKFALARRHMICRAALRAGLGQFARDSTFAYEHLVQAVRGHGAPADEASEAKELL